MGTKYKGEKKRNVIFGAETVLTGLPQAYILTYTETVGDTKGANNSYRSYLPFRTTLPQKETSL